MVSMPAGYKIRYMEIDDIETVAAIDREIFPDPWSGTGLFSFLIRNDTVFLTAEDADGIAGYCGCQCAADEADIITLVVKEEKRRSGIGRELLYELICLAKAHGAVNIYLEVRAGNEPAKALYRNFGFTENGIRKAYYSDPTEDAVNMKYEIKN